MTRNGLVAILICIAQVGFSSGEAALGQDHSGPGGTEPAADGALKPIIVTIDAGLGGQKLTTYRPTSGSTWNIPAGWYAGINGFTGVGYAVYVGFEYANPQAHTCTGLQVKWWYAGAGPDDYWTETENPGDYPSFPAGGTANPPMPSTLNDGTAKAQLYCTSCPCMCDEATFTVVQVP